MMLLDISCHFFYLKYFISLSFYSFMYYINKNPEKFWKCPLTEKPTLK